MRGSVVTVLAAVVVGCGGGGGGSTNPPPPPVFTTLQVSPDTATLTGIGATTQLTAQPLDQNGTAMTGLGAATWSSGDESTATVSSTGLVTSVQAGGPVTVTASLTSGSVTKTGTSAITVAGIPNTAAVTATTSQTFVPSSVDILAGGTVTWTFQSLAHTVTFDAVPGAPADIGTVSSPVANQQVSRTFAQAGTFTYKCLIHAGMTGTVVVH